MMRAGVAAVGLMAAAGMARADVIEQSLTYDWSFEMPQQAFSFEPFDTQGGTRELTGVRLGFQGTLELGVLAQTYGDALGAGEWFVDASHVYVAYFNGGEEGLELFEPVAIFAAHDITGDLGAGFPGEGFEWVDSMFVSASVNVSSEYFGGFSGAGPLTGFFDGFFDAAVIPPENEQWVEVFASHIGQSGTFTLTYEYTAAPAPGAAAAIGLMGLAAGARRRRG